MQVFLPFPSFEESVLLLDKGRLLKQLVECQQILNIIEKKKRGEKPGYFNHPAVLIWENYEEALTLYYCEAYELAKEEGIRFNKLKEKPRPYFPVIPPIVGYSPFHISHQSQLLRKALSDMQGMGRNGKKKKNESLHINFRITGGLDRSIYDNLYNFQYVPLPYVWKR